MTKVARVFSGMEACDMFGHRHRGWFFRRQMPEVHAGRPTDPSSTKPSTALCWDVTMVFLSAPPRTVRQWPHC
jgi:hypothetical protein